MYIWVILATFMVALYSFNLSHRADMKELIVVPQAEAVVGKMVAQHKGAEKYLLAHKKEKNANAEYILFYPGELHLDGPANPSPGKNAGIRDYLPYGFLSDEEVGDFKTMVYCLDKNDPNLSIEAPGCGGGVASCCAGKDAEVYLLTFGCVPRKWRNIRTNTPRAEFFKAMRNIAVNGREIGYAEYLTASEKVDPQNVYNSKMAMRARNLNFIPIPQYIVNEKLPGASLSFSDVCGENNVDDEGAIHSYGCDKCLMYMSTIVTY